MAQVTRILRDSKFDSLYDRLNANDGELTKKLIEDINAFHKFSGETSFGGRTIYNTRTAEGKKKAELLDKIIHSNFGVYNAAMDIADASGIDITIKGDETGISIVLSDIPKLSAFNTSLIDESPSFAFLIQQLGRKDPDNTLENLDNFKREMDRMYDISQIFDRVSHEMVSVYLDETEKQYELYLEQTKQSERTVTNPYDFERQVFASLNLDDTVERFDFGIKDVMESILSNPRFIGLLNEGMEVDTPEFVETFEEEMGQFTIEMFEPEFVSSESQPIEIKYISNELEFFDENAFNYRDEAPASVGLDFSSLDSLISSAARSAEKWHDEHAKSDKTISCRDVYK